MKFDMKMVLAYAKVFEENADYGDPDAAAKSTQGAIAAKGGQTIVDAYFTSEADIEKLREAGMQEAPLGHPRVRDGDPEFGIGKYIKLKRDVMDNVKVFEQKKGPATEVNYGGLPRVIDFRDPDNKGPWDYEEMGSLGNGTKAIVKFDMYSKGAGFRLEAIAVQELVEYVPTEKSEYADVWDD